MINRSQFIKLSLFSISFTSLILGASSDNSIDSEIESLFGQSPTKLSIETTKINQPKTDNYAEKNKIATKTSNTEAVLPKESISLEEEFLVEDISAESSSKTATERGAIENILTKEVKRTEKFSVALEPDAIRYTLPSSLEEVKIELLGLDGAVFSEVNHSSSEVGGTFDTAKLNDGYYIVRISDSTGKAMRIARAVAITH